MLITLTVEESRNSCKVAFVMFLCKKFAVGVLVQYYVILGLKHYLHFEAWLLCRETIIVDWTKELRA